MLEAGDVQSALSIARKEKPRIVLIDCDDDGGSFAAEICTALKADTETADIRIITIGGRPEGPQAAVFSLADGSIGKPFSPLQLLYRVRDLIGEDLA